MDVQEAKRLQKAITEARLALNEAIIAARARDVVCEVEVRRIEKQHIGGIITYYDVIDTQCFINPSKLD